ncbi:MAG: ornithine carbamoyltransferase [Desulfatiglandaceae bacterium]
MVRSLLTTDDLTLKDLLAIFDRAQVLKKATKARKVPDVLKHRIIGILFEKPSTRTRTSFESAILRLDGKAIYLAPGNLQIERGEPIKDTARMLGAYLDALVARVYSHDTVEALAQHAGIPVINGLSDFEHPTQAVCDLFTILEVKGKLEGVTLAYIGDGNNVCHSLLLACALAGMHMKAACPPGYCPDPDLLGKARDMAQQTGASLQVMEDPKEAAANAEVLYTDVWVSMGEEKDKTVKLEAFEGYQINEDLLRAAADDASVMHCLPAYRGLEITDEVIEGPRSIVWQQAENKMYGAAGILAYLLS